MRDRTTPLDVVQLGETDYVAAWDRQRGLAAARVEGTGGDTVLLLTHPAVYTAGRRTRPADRPVDGTPVVDVDRGGSITWHGPGQLVGYPIVKLNDPIDVVAYVRLLEQMLISVCEDVGLTGIGRVTGRSGVWLPMSAGRPERKIAAIGVRIARGVTMHGFALNCDPDLSAFDRMVPCGIADAGVTSLSQELGRRIGVQHTRSVVARRIRQALDGELAVDERLLARPVVAPSGTGRHLDPALTP